VTRATGRRPRAAQRGVALLLSALLPAAPASAAEVDVELVLAADGSGSIDHDELAPQREGYAAALTSLSSSTTAAT
jgi:Protein of unknown function (DUF1194)